MATGDVSDGVSPRDDGETESEGYSQQPNATDVPKRPGNDGRTASAEDKPERAEEFRSGVRH